VEKKVGQSLHTHNIACTWNNMEDAVFDPPACRLTIPRGPVIQVLAIEKDDGIGWCCLADIH
jgi:hypothetical protein